MKTRELQHPSGGTLKETYAYEIDGECGLCHTPVVKVEGSSMGLRTNGVRFRRVDGDESWSLFRCHGCHEVIDATWLPVPVVEVG